MLSASFSTLSLDAPPLFLDLLKLPRPLALAIFARLPVDTRLRCSEVKRAWRVLLTDMSLWGRLDLSFVVARLSLPLLRAAVAKAGGRLRALDISGHQVSEEDFLLLSRVLLEVVAANAATLTELRLNTEQPWRAPAVQALLQGAPALQVLTASVALSVDEHQLARPMLRHEPPFQALQMRQLCMARGLDTTADIIAFGLDLCCHTSLESIILFREPMEKAAAMGAVVNACIAIGVAKLELAWCCGAPEVLPELTRLVAAGALRQLDVVGVANMFDDAHESTRLFVAAVRASALTRLRLVGAALPGNVVEAAAFIHARSQ